MYKESIYFKIFDFQKLTFKASKAGNVKKVSFLDKCNSYMKKSSKRVPILYDTCFY